MENVLFTELNGIFPKKSELIKLNFSRIKRARYKKKYK